MDHAGYLAAVFRLDRDTIAAVAHGYDRVLQIAAQGAVDQGVQLAVNALACILHCAPDLL